MTSCTSATQIGWGDVEKKMGKTFLKGEDMANLESLEECIQEIGREMVPCDLHCRGIALDPERGIIPRCLVLETEERDEGKGSAIIGINPGQSSDSERHYYRRNRTYEHVAGYWWEHNTKWKYNKKLHHFVDELNLTGPIVWTELVKCENAPGVTGLPLQTFRTCVDRYLREEIKCIPEEWPLIAVGRQPYEAVAYLFADRTVLGTPHPNSRGYFARLFCEDGRLKKNWRNKIVDFLENYRGNAAWLLNL